MVVNKGLVPPLGGDEDPDLGVFFLLASRKKAGGAITNRQWKEDESANGMAFVVHADGLLATAAHVLWLQKIGPGDTVEVMGASPAIPLRMRAHVLERGWCGPRVEPGGLVPMHPEYQTYADFRPDVLREDCAFLQLDLRSAVLEPRGGACVDANAALSNLRTLPVGVPGYPQSCQQELAAWWVLRNFGQPTLHRGVGKFKSDEPSQHRAFSLWSSEITHGFSGSPVWDPQRRLVVGFVRSGVSPKMPDTVIAGDTRALTVHPAVVLSVDRELEDFARAVSFLLQTDAFVRHAAVVQHGHGAFIEPRLSKVSSELRLEDDGARKGGLPAIAHLGELLRQHPVVVICCGAGTGKSTLMAEFARRLLEQPDAILPGRRLLPLLVTASEIADNSWKLEDLLKPLLRRLDAPASNAWRLATVLQVNAVELILMVDGLDEVEAVQVPRLLAELHRLQRDSGTVARIVVTTRDAMVVGPKGSTHRWQMPVVEILPFDPSAVRQFAEERFRHRIKDIDGFVQALADRDWAVEATPLQLDMAATLFDQPGGLPSREADVVFAYVEHRIANPRLSADLSVDQFDDPEHWPTLQRNVVQLLRGIAYSTHRKGGTSLAALQAGLAELSGLPGYEAFSATPRACLDFIVRRLSRSVGLVSVRWLRNDQETPDGRHALRAPGAEPELVWEHQTIMQALAAEAIVDLRMLGGCHLQETLPELESRDDHRLQLTLLAALDRRDQLRIVERRLSKAIASPFSMRKESLLALRALAAGIRVTDGLRDKLVQLLVRIAFSITSGGVLCAELFYSGSPLPSPVAILRRPELRDIVKHALWNRFKFRNPRRHGMDKPLLVTDAEAKVLDAVDMWNEWIPDLSLRRRSEQTPLQRPEIFSRGGQPTSLRVIDRGGFSVAEGDSPPRRFELPARAFLEGAVAMARQLSTEMTPSQVIDLYLQAADIYLRDIPGQDASDHAA
ncbi:NACHT domain-containing protein [Pseudorhodoferax sp.]|uniref:NACHT domain-containing protein n=1 Tax=Pseudorhodoferax sp. TaxID=1993553 RepID=UPI0039E57681